MSKKEKNEFDEREWLEQAVIERRKHQYSKLEEDVLNLFFYEEMEKKSNVKKNK
jgi:hypothetical protein